LGGRRLIRVLANEIIITTLLLTYKIG